MQITDQFDPNRAIQTLKDNAIAINDLGQRLHETRLDYIQAKAKLMDKEAEARELLFGGGEAPCKATQTRDWIKWYVAAEHLEHDKLQEQIRGLKDRMEVLVEVNNSLKASHRIIELEIKNQL